MISKADIYENNSYNLCEPDCQHLKKGPFGRTARCTYYDKELEKWEQPDSNEKLNIGQSQWFICGACYEACFDDPYFKEIDDNIEEIEESVGEEVVKKWKKDFYGR